MSNIVRCRRTKRAFPGCHDIDFINCFVSFNRFLIDYINFFYKKLIFIL